MDWLEKFLNRVFPPSKNSKDKVHSTILIKYNGNEKYKWGVYDYQVLLSSSDTLEKAVISAFSLGATEIHLMEV